jgi:hypothetical protein
MRQGTGHIEFTLTPDEAEESDDMLVKFSKAHDEVFMRVYVLMPKTRQMKGMFKVMPEQVQNMADVFGLIAGMEDEE